MVLAQENVDSLLTEGDVLWLLGDHQGTIRDVVEYNHLTDETDHLEHYRYDSYGNLTEITEADGVTVISTDRGDALTTRQYTGRTWDDVSELQYNRNRWYNPQTGRWMSEDPIGFAGGTANLQEYVGNNPANFTDPWGLEPKLGAAIGNALAAGDIEGAMILMQGIRGANALKLTAPALTAIYNRYPVAAGKYVESAHAANQFFRAAGQNPIVLEITNPRGSGKWLHYTNSAGKVIEISSNGRHQAVLVNNRVYDAITGPQGMALSDYYRQVLVHGIGLAPPKACDLAGKVIPIR